MTVQFSEIRHLGIIRPTLMTTSLGREQLPLLKSVSDSSSVLLFTARCQWVDSTTGEENCFHHLASHAVWPDWANFCTLGNFLKPVATIILPNSHPLLGNF